MGPDESIETLIGFAIGDFECAWNAMVKDKEATSGGNFPFACQGMMLLELACRLCAADESKEAIKDFSEQLHKRDRKYFTELPGSCKKPSGFDLPSRGPKPESELIAFIFDFIRNGQAHQSQQIIAELTDGKHFYFPLIGAGRPEGATEPTPSLKQTFERNARYDHLQGGRTESGDMVVVLRTDVLFIDIREAIKNAALLSRSLTLKPWRRKGNRDGDFRFSSKDLQDSLGRGGHFG